MTFSLHRLDYYKHMFSEQPQNSFNPETFSGIKDAVKIITYVVGIKQHPLSQANYQ